MEYLHDFTRPIKPAHYPSYNDNQETNVGQNKSNNLMYEGFKLAICSESTETFFQVLYTSTCYQNSLDTSSHSILGSKSFI